MVSKALFLDRDGVINQEMGDYVFKKEDFHFEDGIVDLCRKALNKGFLLIVVTNQGGIQKGLYSIEEVDRLHAWMKDYFDQHQCPITDIYFSPYHKDLGKNILSKPSSLMLEKACAKYGIDARQSWMIGDRVRDIEAGKRVGCRTVGIGEDSANSGADYWVPTVKSLSQSEWVEKL